MAWAASQALKHRVHLHDRHRCARAGALVLPLPCDPGLEARQLPPQRPHLQHTLPCSRSGQLLNTRPLSAKPLKPACILVRP